MTEYNEGDLVEAVKGESVVRGRIHQGGEYRGNRGYRYLGDSGALDEVYLKGGWTVTVIEKAAPVVVLPTEPGAYASNQGSVFVLNSDGDWLDFSLWRGRVNNPAVANPAYHPFTPLEPVSETAKKVLDRIRKDSSGDGGYFDHQYTARQLRELFAEFGVTA